HRYGTAFHPPSHSNCVGKLLRRSSKSVLQVGICYTKVSTCDLKSQSCDTRSRTEKKKRGRAQREEFDMVASTNPAAPAAAPSSNFRWMQLIIGLICMAMMANLQYGWTFFVGPMAK